MIRYALQCDREHPFEAWFGSSDDYDAQAAAGRVECPFCASRQVAKQIMAPAVRTSDCRPEDAASQDMMMDAAAAIRRRIETEFDYVGDAFAREARAIHEGDSEKRSIYGEASASEVKALEADGVPCAPLPAALSPKPKTGIH
ncbi:MAG: DUF1178 family protein [Caulobacterales bacterium]|nr:DUF1178 family protein [Caulobacterales bacterium]